MKITVLVPKIITHTPTKEWLDHIHDVTYLYLGSCSRKAISQIKKTIKNTDIYLNLYDISNDCGQSIVNYLYENNLPYTGVNSDMYDPTREVLKIISRYSELNTPNYIFVDDVNDVDDLHNCKLKYPMFVKPQLGYDSVGIDAKSKVNNIDELKKQALIIVDRFGGALIEEFVDGREFSVLVSGSIDCINDIVVFDPVEYVFNQMGPSKINFLTEQDKSTESVEYWYSPCTDENIIENIKKIGKKLFIGFSCTGYVRIDIRQNKINNKFYILDINPYCSLFMSTDLNKCSTADKILKYNNWSFEKFLDHIIQVGLNRYQRNKKNYYPKYIDDNKKFGLYSNKNIKTGEIIYSYEMCPHVLISRNKIESMLHYKDTFDSYKYPVSDNVFIAWDDNPKNWKPINHSCDPNSWITDLNLYARYDIPIHTEITIDYSTFLICEQDFNCMCESMLCRKKIKANEYSEDWFISRYGDHTSDYIKNKQNNTNKKTCVVM